MTTEMIQHYPVRHSGESHIAKNLSLLLLILTLSLAGGCGGGGAYGKFPIPLPPIAPPPTTVKAITTGYDHTCALTSNGGVKCWGDNRAGQIGDGTLTESLSPVDVIGLTNGSTTISAGHSHTCALSSNGGVKCWGHNGDGQIGDGTQTGRLSPVEVIGLTSGIIAISVGAYHTCALTSIGGVKCWGDNLLGELGEGIPKNKSTTPVDVSGLTSGAIAVAANYFNTCALTTSGGAKCWGENGSGELGDGTTDSRSTPVDVIGLTSGVIAIAMGENHTCALTTNGGVKCWGENGGGSLGDGTNTERLTPVNVSGLTSGIIAVSAGSAHTCALTTSGGLKCWGNNNFGQLGDGTTTVRFTPVDVSGLTRGVIAISTGEDHTCALTTSGVVKCWGYNGYGQLGDGTTTNRLTPVEVSGLTSVGI